MRNFRKFEVWKRSMKLADLIFILLKYLPNEEKYGIQSQMSRAAVSVPSNIAEGCSRSSDKEFKRYIEIALGSSFEIETLIEICISRNYIDIYKSHQIKSELNTLQRQLNGLHQKLSRKQS